MRILAGIAALFLTALPAVLAGTPPAAAQAGGGSAQLFIELNKLEQIEGHCRAYFVIENRSDRGYADLKLDVFIFDAEGLIQRRFAMSTGRLRPSKTVVRLFEIPDLECGAAQRFLMNEVLACTGEDGAAVDCAVTVQGRGELRFDT